MTPPDSGEREVRLQMALAVFSDMANPQRGMAEADAETRAHWLQSCARHALVKLSDAAPGDFSLIRTDLAQRILAALEEQSHRCSDNGRPRSAEHLYALASELRAAVERKP
jgi:2-phospho-L-lactate transferase/gluconeogenesis factor (CofD/UPF0052 family)